MLVLMTKELNSEEVRFLDPDYGDNDSSINVGEYMFYHDIYKFVDHLKDIK